MHSQSILRLIKRELYEKRKPIIWLSLFSILIFFFTFPKQFYSANLQDGQGFVRFLFVSIGSYLAGTAFWEFNSAARARNYLLIPASHVEKIIAKLSVYIFGWWLLFIGAWLFAGISSNLVFNSINDSPGTINSIFSIFSILLPLLPGVFFAQSLSFFASCYFKKSALFKLAIVILGLSIIIASIATAEISWLIKHSDLGTMNNFSLLPKINMSLLTTLANFGSIILGIGACLLSCLRLRETEAK